MAPKTRIGILGGTFNPIHIGHLIVAQSAFEVHDLAKVLFIPCAHPPHNESSSLVSAAHRLAMVQAATDDDWRFEASDIEIARGGVSFAVETVRQLRDLHPEADFHFIIGADTLLELYLWRDVYRLLALCTFATFARPGVDTASLGAADLHLDPPWPERLLKNVTRMQRVEISSSDIRHRVAEGQSIRYLVPMPVEVYIAEHHLYGHGQ